MKVSLEELRALPHERLAVTFNEEVAGLSAIRPVVGELAIALNPAGAKISGRVKTLLKLQCHRCLRPYFHSLTVDIDERFVHRFDQGSEQPRERELRVDDFVETLPDDGVLDISDVVYQAVTLATPVNCLCGKECPGPPRPDDQAALAVNKEGEPPLDPRWKNLKTLFPKDETGGNS